MSTNPIDPPSILAQLSSEEKISLLSGDDMWHTAPIPRLGIPRVRSGDGPNGVRGTAWTNGAPSSCFPCATGLGASFDHDLAGRVGSALGAECRARGVHCLLGPTTNIQRHPCGGRGFESYGEDPYHSGSMASAWIKGVQSHKVMTSPKHYLANEQEHLRRSMNSVMDERTMHEIYLEPFRLQAKMKPAVFMSSYNRVNGVHVAEHPYLLRKILRQDFQFDGMIMSDWSGTHSSSEAIKASLDLEMPGPAIMRGASLERDIVGGKLRNEDIDECVLRVLNFVKTAQLSDIPFEAEVGTIDTPEVRSLLRESAGSGVVLLKNSASSLPIKAKSGTKIAVIGPNAKASCYAGGGSASLFPTYTVTPVDAISEDAKELGATVEYVLGADNTRWTPLLNPFITLPDGKDGDGPGVHIEFFDVNPWENEGVKPLFTKFNNSSFSYFIDGIPKEVPVRGYVSLRTRFTPDVSGTWVLGLGVAGQGDLYVDGTKVVDNSTKQTQGLLFFNTGSDEHTGEIELEGGKSYQLEVRFSNFKQLNAMSPYSGRRGGIRIGGRPKYDTSQEIAKAVELSQKSDVTILVIGTNAEWESEAFDRENMKLPKGADDLVEAILKINPNVIIVNQSGMPVEMPWIRSSSTVVQAFFGGNEVGNGISDVLFGRVNPSGKLPITWPVKVEDFPSHEGFGDDFNTVYHEGIYVGYRWFDRPGRVKSLFPYGFGLSYSTFSFSDLRVKPVGRFGAEVTFTITNTSSIAGAEVGQVYIHHTSGSASVEKPEIELVGFAKALLQPEEGRKLSVTLDHKAFSYYSVQEKAWIGDKGDYEIRVGSSSRDIKLVKPFHLEESCRWIGLGDPEIL